MTIHFQLLDYAEINDNIILFGVDKKGNSISCQINNYKPYFYIKQENQNEIKSKKDKYTVTDVIGKSFYGYREDNEIFKKITFKNLTTYKRCKYEYRYKIIDNKSIKTNEKLFDKTYEASFSPVLRFLQDRNITCSSWVSVNNYEITDGETKCKICISTEPDEIYNFECDDIAPIYQASLDIECYSSIDGQFPSPDIKGDEVIQIALVLKRIGEETIKKYLFTQKISNKIEDCILYCCKNEKELFDKFSKIFLKEDPDIIYTYNGDWFDFHYLFTRAEKYNYDSFFSISRLPNSPPEIQNTNFTSGAYGSTDYRRLIIPGRINFDLLIYINREFKLRSYKLDDVAEHFLKQNKLPISPKQIFEYYADGDPEKIKQVGEYCIQDTVLLQLLVDKLSILINQMEMSKATYVPIRFLWERGQQIKVYSQIIRKTKEVNYFIPDSKFIPDEEKFQGATVLEPMTGAYFNPIIVLDFASLYPSVIRAYNLCYSSILLTNDSLKDEDILTVETDLGDFKFVQNKSISIIPKLLEELLQKRINTKTQMKTETDQFKLTILDKKQNSYKVSMNSVYGFFASHMIKCKPIAASTTALGRKMITFTKEFIETNYKDNNCKIIYGDTDSVFVNSDITDVSESFQLGKKMAEEITKRLKHPLKLEFEKSYNPLLLIGKKMYVGKLYSSSSEKYDYVDKKGVVSKRRDNANIVPKLYNQTIEHIMNNDGYTAIKYIKNELLKLVSGKFDINDLIITKTLKGNYKNVNVPHNQLSIKMKERDPSTAPKSNDRVRYVFIENEFDKQYEKVEDPDYVIANNLKIDTVYYIIHQLEAPLSQILKLISEDGNDVFKNVISDYKLKQKKLKIDSELKKSGQRKITEFFKQ